MDMNCAELGKVAAELALGVLTGRERADAVAHLAGCDACREDVRQLIETHDGLVGLLPQAEPPAGFETRVLARLGMTTARSHRAGVAVRREAPPRETARETLPGDSGSRVTEPRGPETPRGGVRRPAGPQGPPGRGAVGRRRRGASRSRRLLVAGALVLAIAGAGLSGWGLGMGTAARRPGPPPPISQQVPLASAALLTASHQSIGQLFYYQGSPRWLYMWVELPVSNGMVTCKLVGTDGKVSTVGSFPVAGGYGSWGSPDPGDLGQVRGAKLYSSNGTLLATANFG
jgi:hypothetical protein